MKTALKEDFFSAQLQIKLCWSGEEQKASYYLYHPNGKLIRQGRVEHDVAITVDAPLLWNAEMPNLYRLVLSTDDEKHRTENQDPKN